MSNEQAVAIIQPRDDAGLDKGGAWGYGEVVRRVICFGGGSHKTGRGGQRKRGLSSCFTHLFLRNKLPLNLAA